MNNLISQLLKEFDKLVKTDLMEDGFAMGTRGILSPKAIKSWLTTTYTPRVLAEIAKEVEGMKWGMPPGHIQVISNEQEQELYNLGLRIGCNQALSDILTLLKSHEQ